MQEPLRREFTADAEEFKPRLLAGNKGAVFGVQRRSPIGDVLLTSLPLDGVFPDPPEARDDALGNVKTPSPSQKTGTKLQH